MFCLCSRLCLTVSKSSVACELLLPVLAAWALEACSSVRTLSPSPHQRCSQALSSPSVQQPRQCSQALSPCQSSVQQPRQCSQAPPPPPPSTQSSVFKIGNSPPSPSSTVCVASSGQGQILFFSLSVKHRYVLGSMASICIFALPHWPLPLSTSLTSLFLYSLSLSSSL